MVEVKKNFTLGRIFGETFNLYFQNFMRLIIPAVIFFGASFVLIFLAYLQRFSSSNIFLIIAFLVIGIFFLPFYYYQIQVASNCYLKKNESPSALISLSVKKFFPLLGMTLLFLLGEILATIALVIPAYILMVGWSLNYVVLAIERKGAVASLKRSWELTKGYKGKLFLIYLILSVLIYAIVSIAMILGQWNITGVTSEIIGNSGGNSSSVIPLGVSILYGVGYTILFPLYAVFLIVIYYNILKDKEGFATEQLAEEFMS